MNNRLSFSTAPLAGVFGFLLVLSGCSSHSIQAVQSLDSEHASAQSQACGKAMERAETNEELFRGRVVAGPLLMIASGGTLALPVIAAQLGLDTKDRVDAAEIKSTCNDKAYGASDIAIGVAGSAALTAVGAQLPVGPAAANTK